MPPAPHGQVVRRIQDQRGAHDRRRLPHVGEIRSDDSRTAALRIELVGDDGTTTVLRESVKVRADEIVDASAMSAAALRQFLTEQIARAQSENVLFSLHLKATMMRVSDPIIFGHTVRAFFPQLFAEYEEALAAAGGDPDEGLGASSPSGAEAACRGARES